MQAVEAEERNWLQEMEKKRASRERARLMPVTSEQANVDQRKSIRSSRLHFDINGSRKTNGVDA
jgi:hypothetical protein